MSIILWQKKSQRYKRIVSFLNKHVNVMFYVRINILQCLVKFFNSAFFQKGTCDEKSKQTKSPERASTYF